MRKLFVLICLFSSFLSCANSIHDFKAPKTLNQSNQFLLVTAQNWNEMQGKLQRYQRDPITKEWSEVGDPMPVVIGSNGMALDLDFTHYSIKGPIKKEGDLRTPIGIFKLGPAFGFDSTSQITKNFEYLSINETTLCVDDQKSHYYNQVLDSSSVSNPDWQSREEMKKISCYRYGMIIQNNHHPKIPGGGSCIFMHLWTSNKEGTYGCIAMDESNLKQVLSWLDQDQNPTIGVFPSSVYKDIGVKWGLPNH